VKLYSMAHPHDSSFHSFLAKMEVAVEMDVSLNWAGKPAIEKLFMLPRLWAVIHNCKSSLQLELIRCGVLASLRKWLEPFPDRVVTWMITDGRLDDGRRVVRDLDAL
jgi:hypothetical protein